MDFQSLEIGTVFLIFSVLPNYIQSISLNTRTFRNSSQLTPLGVLCKQEGPIDLIPMFLSLASPLRIVVFPLRNLTSTVSEKASKISKRNIFYAIKYIMLIKLSYGSGFF